VTGRDWTRMGRRDFDTAAFPVQEALFALPDPQGTADLFETEEDDQ
jgi:hypothetical protein